MVSGKSSNGQKYDFPHHQRKFNASLDICHEKKTKNLIMFWLTKDQNGGMILNQV